jgi:hypothetical protein
MTQCAAVCLYILAAMLLVAREWVLVALGAVT